MIDPLKELHGYVLRRASSTWQAIVSERIQELGIGLVDASILVGIHANPRIKQAELCLMLSIKPANMTPRIARLIDAGWVRREPLDGRSSALALTSAGIELRDQAWAIMKDHEERLIRRVGEHRSEAFLSSIHDLWNTSPTSQL